MIRILFIAVLALSGCALMTADDFAFPPAELPVTVQTVPHQEITEFAIVGDDGSVVIRDRAMTGICHKQERDGAYLRDGVLTFWRAHVGDKYEICPQVGRFAAYEAKVEGLAPGTYHVRVEYIGYISSDLYPRPQLEATVTVE